MFKKQEGITLVALVITIIVLLILAGVTIAMLTGQNGILTKSKEAVNKSINTTTQENYALENYAEQAEYYSNQTP